MLYYKSKGVTMEEYSKAKEFIKEVYDLYFQDFEQNMFSYSSPEAIAVEVIDNLEYVKNINPEGYRAFKSLSKDEQLEIAEIIAEEPKYGR